MNKIKVKEINVPATDWAFSTVGHHTTGVHEGPADMEISNYVHTYVHAIIEASRAVGQEYLPTAEDIDALCYLPVYTIGCGYLFKSNSIGYDDSEAHQDDKGKWRNGNMISREYLIGGDPIRHDGVHFIVPARYDRKTTKTGFIPFYYWVPADGYIHAVEVGFDWMINVFLAKAYENKNNGGQKYGTAYII